MAAPPLIRLPGRESQTIPTIQELSVQALRVDLRWIRQHTDIGEAAERWASPLTGGDHVLLRGKAISDAERWISSRPSEAPEPTETQRVFVQASREAELARNESERASLRSRQRLLSSAIALLLCLLVGIVGWVNRPFVEKQIYWVSKVAPFVLSNSKESTMIAKDTFKECVDCPDMVVVSLPAAGSGKNDAPESEGLPALIAISKYEITFDNWDICVSQGGCFNTADDENWGRGKRPVINISWQDAQQFVYWLSQLTGRKYRLLTSAEWDRLAVELAKTAKNPEDGTDSFSGGEPAEIPIGQDTEPEQGDVGTSVDGQSETEGAQMETEPVGLYQPNVFGIYDLEGNVSEWVFDCFKEAEVYGGITTSYAPLSTECNRRVIKGDSWKFTFKNRTSDGKEVIGYAATKRSNYVGMRVTRELTYFCK